MAATPAVQPELLKQAESTPTISQPKRNYSATTICPEHMHAVLRDEFQDLSPSLKVQVESLASVMFSAKTEMWDGCPNLTVKAIAALKVSDRTANCRRHANVTDYCKRFNYGEGNLHLCNDIMDPYCGQGKSRSIQWLKDRDEGAICAKPQVGIELTMPASAWEPYYELQAFDLIPEPTTRTYWLDSQDVLQERASKFVAAMDCAYIIHDAAPYMDIISENCEFHMMGKHEGPRDCTVSVRVVLQVDRVHTGKVTELWRSIAGPRATCKFRHSGGVTGKDGRKLLDWVFGGFESILSRSGDERARFRLELIDEKTGRTRRVVRSGGEHYRTLPVQKVEDRAPRVCPCPECQAERALLIHISMEDQHTESVHDIFAKFKEFKWVAKRGPELPRTPAQVIDQTIDAEFKVLSRMGAPDTAKFASDS